MTFNVVVPRFPCVLQSWKVNSLARPGKEKSTAADERVIEQPICAKGCSRRYSSYLNFTGHDRPVNWPSYSGIAAPTLFK